MDDDARARYMLELLHRAGYDLSAVDGELVITANATANWPVDKPLLDYVAPWRTRLLSMLTVADAEMARIRRDSKGNP